MGTPDFAVPSLIAFHSSHHQIVAVVTQPDRPSGRGLKLRSPEIKIKAIELGYPVLQPESLKSDEFYSQLRDCYPDILVVLAFRILPERIFSMPEFGSINAHASLLPKYRGAAPIHRAIINGEKYTGVTTFQIAKNIDTGSILMQEKIPILQNDTTGLMWDKLANLSASMLIKTVEGISNHSLNPLIQDHSMASPAPKIKKDETKINWQDSAESIHNQIRAFSPFPGAFTNYHGKRIKLFSSSVSSEELTNDITPGNIVISNDGLKVQCNTDMINIDEVQIEGKRRMYVKDFISGYGISSGKKFE
jgi:methionyl-tRNA formyltransferase